VLNEKQSTANQCDGLFFFQRHFVFVVCVDGWAAGAFGGGRGAGTIQGTQHSTFIEASLSSRVQNEEEA
jgi:hypothetical protein